MRAGYSQAPVKLGQSSASPKLTTVGLKTGLAGAGWCLVAAVLSKCDIKTTCGSAASHRCCFAATNNYNSTNESLKLFMNLGNFRGFCPANIFYISAASSQAPAWTPGVIDLCKTWPGVETIFLTLSLVSVNKLLTRVTGDL